MVLMMSRLASLNSMAATTMTAPTAAYRLSSLHRKPAVLCAMTPHTVQLRRFAKKSAAAAPEPTTSAKEDAVPGPGDVVEGLNIYKDGSDVKLKPDEEYPDWVWKIHIPKPTLSELMTIVERDGPDALSPDLQRRLIREWNRARIKAKNSGEM
mmetsp:Transcript_59457/g.128931  ORF Transcript_59457/g.128931 Transcript_59457/m.128931 type:complete len:153 (+) Transcript_59457:53-511(+)